MKFYIVWRNLHNNFSGRGTVAFERDDELDACVEKLNLTYAGVLTHWLEAETPVQVDESTCTG